MVEAPSTMDQTEQTPQQQQDSLALLNRVEALIDLERSLTDALEKSEPLLNKGNTESNKSRGGTVRPIPSDIDEVVRVLAVSRALAARTSAPAGWNSSLPVVGFATPNPLPHQLRGGALGTLQLELAKQQEKQTTTSKKRNRDEKESEEKESSQKKAKKTQEDEGEEQQSMDPKRRDLVHHKHELDRTDSELTRNRRMSNPRKGPLQPVLATTMNLSDSSSSSEEEDESD